MSVEIPSKEHEPTPDAPASDDAVTGDLDGPETGDHGGPETGDHDGPETGEHGGTVDVGGLFERVLVVTDEEPTGDAAVDAAIDLAATHDATVDVRKRLRDGTDHEAVIEYAATHDVDVIVVGSERRTGLERVADPEPLPIRLQRGASCPVLVVGVDDV